MSGSSMRTSGEFQAGNAGHYSKNEDDLEDINGFGARHHGAYRRGRRTDRRLHSVPGAHRYFSQRIGQAAKRHQ